LHYAEAVRCNQPGGQRTIDVDGDDTWRAGASRLIDHLRDLGAQVVRRLVARGDQDRDEARRRERAWEFEIPKVTRLERARVKKDAQTAVLQSLKELFGADLVG